MIGYLEGNIVAKDERSITIRTGEVGWRVFCGSTTLAKLGKKKEKLSLFTHLYSREDAQELYGFTSHDELRFFEALILVSGVGPRSAQALIDTLTLQVLVGAVQEKRSELLCRVPGIGSKIAQKIIIDLEPRLRVLGFVSEADLNVLQEDDDVISALLSLGYKRHEAREAIRHVPEDIKGVSRRIEFALKNLGR
jgi:Holliday junction DNA helicase RuvA